MSRFESDRIVQLRSWAILKRKEALQKLGAPIAPKKGSFRERFMALPMGKDRDELVYQEAIKMPPPRMVAVTLPPVNGVSASYDVMPDYLTIDGLKVPVSPVVAERIAHHFGLSLPTGKMSKQIYEASTAKIPPKPIDPSSHAITSSKEIANFSDSYQKEMAKYKADDNTIYGGGMKDLIVPEGDPNFVHATGWYDTNGKPIQGFRQSNHGLDYADYSHGTRLTGNFIFKKNGKTIGPLTLEQIMTDPKYKEFIPFISDKPGSYKTYASAAEAKTQKTPAPTVPQTQARSEQVMQKYDEFLDQIEEAVV